MELRSGVQLDFGEGFGLRLSIIVATLSYPYLPGMCIVMVCCLLLYPHSQRTIQPIILPFLFLDRNTCQRWRVTLSTIQRSHLPTSPFGITIAPCQRFWFLDPHVFHYCRGENCLLFDRTLGRSCQSVIFFFYYILLRSQQPFHFFTHGTYASIFNSSFPLFQLSTFGLPPFVVHIHTPLVHGLDYRDDPLFHILASSSFQATTQRRGSHSLFLVVSMSQW